MKKRRLATGALSIALALTMVSTSAFAASVEFTDVPSSHWAHASISEMADKGVVSGTGNNKYSPDLTVSYAQFATMIARSFYNDQIEGDGDKWYSSFMTTAEKVGILEGTKVLGNDALVEAGINRYEMAQVMYNVLQEQLGEIAIDFDTTAIADWASIPDNYKDAVSLCYHYGTLSGTDGKGTFSGTTMMTRAQAAVVMDRLIEVCGGDTPSTPVVPEVPDGAVQITSKKQLTVARGVVECEGGFHMDGSGLTYGMGSIAFTTSGKSTLIFELRAGDTDVVLDVTLRGKEQSIWEPAEVRELGVVPVGTSQSFTIDVSDLQSVALFPGDASNGVSFAECWITNITLS